MENGDENGKEDVPTISVNLNCTNPVQYLRDKLKELRSDDVHMESAKLFPNSGEMVRHIKKAGSQSHQTSAILTESGDTSRSASSSVIEPIKQTPRPGPISGTKKPDRPMHMPDTRTRKRTEPVSRCLH